MFLIPRALLFTAFFVGLLALHPVMAENKAPEARLNTPQGEIKLSDLKGQVIYLDFWASWCGPCRKSFPWMNTLQSQYKDKGLKIIGVNLDSEPEKADQFLSKVPADFTIAMDPEGKIAELFQVKGMPTSYLIDRQGNLRLQHIGFRQKDTEKLEAKIKNLLDE